MSLCRRLICDLANFARWRSIGIGDRGMGVLDDEAPLGAPRVLEWALLRPDLRAVSLSSGCLKPLQPLDVQCQTHQVPLALDLVQAAQAESAEAEHFLDPPVDLFDFAAWRDRAVSFEAMAAYAPQAYAVTAPGVVRQESVMEIAGDFWAITGASAAFGRLFASGDRDSLVVTFDSFDQILSGDSRWLGRTLNLDGRSFNIAGILEPDYRLVLLAVRGDTPEPRLYISIQPAPSRPGPMMVRLVDGIPVMSGSVIARIREGVTVTQAEAEIDAIHAATVIDSPARMGDDSVVRIVTLHDRWLGGARRALAVLGGAAAFVLLVAVANAANLWLARHDVRRREVAVRMAVGANRMHVIRQYLTESIILGLAGGAVGLVLASSAIVAIQRWWISAVPGLQSVTVDGWVIRYTLALSVVTGIVCGGLERDRQQRFDHRHGDLYRDCPRPGGRVSETQRGDHAQRGIESSLTDESRDEGAAAGRRLFGLNR